MFQLRMISNSKRSAAQINLIQLKVINKTTMAISFFNFFFQRCFSKLLLEKNAVAIYNICSPYKMRQKFWYKYPNRLKLKSSDWSLRSSEQYQIIRAIMKYFILLSLAVLSVNGGKYLTLNTFSFLFHYFKIIKKIILNK